METNIYKNIVQPEEIDLSGLSTIPALYRKVIGAVGLNIKKEGYGVDVMAQRGLSWVLARCGMEFICRPALYSDLTVHVWKGCEKGACYGRNIEIRDGEGTLIGSGITDWCVLDKRTRKLVVPQLESPLERREVECAKPKRIGLFDGGKEVVGLAGYSECDFNGHLNNCRYVDWFFNLLPEKVTTLTRSLRLDINFKNEIMKGAQFLASIREYGERQIDFCLRQGNSVACLASLSWGEPGNETVGDRNNSIGLVDALSI